jgi:hypothetical protein
MASFAQQKDEILDLLVTFRSHQKGRDEREAKRAQPQQPPLALVAATPPATPFATPPATPLATLRLGATSSSTSAWSLADTWTGTPFKTALPTTGSIS